MIAPPSFLCYRLRMESSFVQYIQKLLRRAHYEYDPSVKNWAGWIEGYPGVYAQAETVEEARADLISTLEDFLILDLQGGKRIPGVSVSPRAVGLGRRASRYAATHKP